MQQVKPPGKGYAYKQRALTKYFINEGWSVGSAIALSRGMIKHGSFLEEHEHAKYLKLEEK